MFFWKEFALKNLKKFCKKKLIGSNYLFFKTINEFKIYGYNLQNFHEKKKLKRKINSVVFNKICIHKAYF